MNRYVMAAQHYDPVSERHHGPQIATNMPSKTTNNNQWTNERTKRRTQFGSFGILSCDLLSLSIFYYKYVPRLDVPHIIHNMRGICLIWQIFGWGPDVTYERHIITCMYNTITPLNGSNAHDNMYTLCMHRHGIIEFESF